MKIKIVLSLCIAFVVSNLLLGQHTQTASVEGITEHQMDNGLKVLLFPDNSAQTITVNITYLVGSRHEGYGEKGMAHLLEHLLFKGSTNHPDIPKELSARGARPNGTTYYDRTNYYETFNATEDNLNWALDLEADRMVNSFIAQKDLESEFSVVRNEFEMGENSPSRVLRQKVIDAAYLWHNYGNSTIGNRSDIERVPIENLKEFYKKFYRPDNAVLLIIGKFDEEKTLALVEQKFGKIKKPTTPIRDSYTEEPPQDGEKIVTVSRVGELQLVSALYHIPAASHEDYAALGILENILTNEPSGRLYKALVETQKASSMWSFSPFTKEPSFLHIQVDIPSDKNASEVETILRENLDNLKNAPITQEEVDRAKANLLKEIDQLTRDSEGFGMAMSEYIGAGDWRLGFINRDRIENTTIEQVNKVASKYLIPTNRTIGRFIPTKTPERVGIPHTKNLDSLASGYKGKENMGSGEAFDVSYEKIQERINSGKLTNGITYGFIEKSNRGNTVNISFSIRNGDEKTLTNKGVIPSFTAQLLNKGTTSKTRQQIEDELSRLKSSIYIGARNGNVYVTVVSTEENLIATMQLMADMLKNPSFDASELEKLKTEELAAIEVNKSEPQFLATNRLSEINNPHPKGHPLYKMTIDELEAAIKAVTIADIKAFYNDFYGLGKSIIVGIGNLKSDELKNFMEKEFNTFESKHPYSKIASPFSESKSITEDIITPDKQNAMTFGGLNIKVSEYSEDYAALTIAATILGGGVLNSRIEDRLRQKDGISYGAGAGFQADSDNTDQNSQMYIYAIYAPSNYDKVRLGFEEEIARFIKDGITEEELKNAVNGWIQEGNVSRAQDGELLTVINNNAFYDRTMAFHKEIETKISTLTVDDINKVIKKYILPLDKWTVVNAGDFKK